MPFQCYMCKKWFKATKTLYHFDDEEMDENGEVSLCDTCLKEAQKLAIKKNQKGLSKRFFKPKKK